MEEAGRGRVRHAGGAGETYDFEGLICSMRWSKGWPRPVGVAAETTVEELCARQTEQGRGACDDVPLWVRFVFLTLSHIHRSSPPCPEAQDSGREERAERRAGVVGGWGVEEEELLWEVAREKSLYRGQSRAGRARPVCLRWRAPLGPLPRIHREHF